jgi:acyl-CoA reductase-like NAD-dependent aldehyde dehydrogenase
LIKNFKEERLSAVKKLTRCIESLLSRAFLPIIVYTMNIQTKNPATGEPLSSYPAMDGKKVKKILEQSQKAFIAWKETSSGVRVRKMKEAARLLRTRAGEYAELMVGNGCVLKHASNVTGCALAIEKIFIDVGFPDHLFSTLIIPSSDVEQVIAHPLIRGVTLTGSDPYIILHNADLESAAQTCAESRLLNSGQS